MFYDLNVDVPICDRARAAQTCASFGYDVIALNVFVSTRKLGPEHLPTPFEFGKVERTLPFDSKRVRVGHANASSGRSIRVLQRITISIEDTSQLACLSSHVLSKYDIVAVAPASEKLLQQCLQFDFDIICLPFSLKSNFYLKRPQLHVAVEKGIVFEISYAELLGDSSARRLIIGNISSAVRVTGGRQTIVSSGSKNCMQLRGPHDVVNLARVFGITHDHALNSVTRTPEGVVSHGDVRCRTYKGIVRLDTDSVQHNVPQNMEL